MANGETETKTVSKSEERRQAAQKKEGTYWFPSLGISVKAESLEEAEKKAKEITHNKN